MKVVYHSNNSGGSWWLADEDWRALEKAGWKVRWFKDQVDQFGKQSDRWLNALAMEASREGLSHDDAVAEWESITGEDPYEEGCSCCGCPHYFSDQS